MRIAMLTVAALLAIFLVAEIGYGWWAHRPYVVTGLTVGADFVGVEYTLPGGGAGEIRYPASLAAATRCHFTEVKVGQPLPDCIRSVHSASQKYPTAPTRTPQPSSPAVRLRSTAPRTARRADADPAGPYRPWAGASRPAAG